jgi:titin
MPPHDDGGSPITSYRIEQSRDTPYDWTKVATVDSGIRHYSVGDLKEGKQYYFRVVAENQMGQSQALESDKIVPHKKIGELNFRMNFRFIFIFFLLHMA